jgi:hypothetical protein
MKGWSGYLWSGTIALAEIDVILYIFAHLEGRLEHIVVSLVGLIYVALYAIAAARDQESLALIESVQVQLIQIRQLLNDTNLPDKQDKIQDRAQRHAITQRLIRDIGLLVIWGVCIFQLFRTL